MTLNIQQKYQQKPMPCGKKTAVEGFASNREKGVKGEKMNVV